jgi:SAM-dependent methyltransferase
VRLDPRWRVLPFPAGSFDAVVASSVLEYVADPAVSLGECARVLAAGGVLVCTVPDVRHPVRWLEWLAARAAGLPLPRRWRRLHGHRAYLRVPRQRHGDRWWQAAAARAGLLAAREVPRPAGGSAALGPSALGPSARERSAPGQSARERSPLRLLRFLKPA